MMRGVNICIFVEIAVPKFRSPKQQISWLERRQLRSTGLLEKRETESVSSDIPAILMYVMDEALPKMLEHGML